MLVGEPVAVEDLLAQAAQLGWGEERLQAAIADRVGQVWGWLVEGQGGAGGKGGEQGCISDCLPACLPAFHSF